VSESSGESSPPSLEVDGLTKWFGGQQALDAVDLTVGAGELHALVGHNGSGKSTLVKILSGYHLPEAQGSVRVDGRELKFGSPRSSWMLGMRFVHQDLALIPSLSIAENVLLGRPTRTSLRLFRPQPDITYVEKSLESFGMGLDPKTLVEDLSDAERAVVAVVRALDDRASSPRLLVLDEVTASMPWPEAKRLMGIVRKVAERGVGVLFITHHIEEVLEGVDRLTVFRDGRRVASTKKALSRDEIVLLMMSKEVEALEARPPSRNDPVDGPTVLKATSLQGRLVASLDLTLNVAEVLGITGLTGSGSEEVVSLLSGRSYRGGVVEVNGQRLEAGDPRAAIALGLVAVPADRARDGLITHGTVRENMTLANLGEFVRHGTIRPSHEKRECQAWIDRLGIVTSSLEAPIETLSGGNQQKAVLARWLRTSPAVLVLDEPTHGVDVSAKAEIHKYIDQASERGTAVIICSSDVEELARLCHRVIFMRRGIAAKELEGVSLTPLRIEALQLGESELAERYDNESDRVGDPQ
jgi:ribose transport system ATP-binding protein